MSWLYWLDDWLSEEPKRLAFERVGEKAACNEHFGKELRVYHEEARKFAVRSTVFFAVVLGSAALIGYSWGVLFNEVWDSHHQPVAATEPRQGEAVAAKRAPKLPAPTALEPTDPGPFPLWREGSGVLQLYTVNDRRSAEVEAAHMRNVFAALHGHNWAVRVVVVPWWGSNRFTVVVNGVSLPAADAMCGWLRAFGRPERPPPAPNRAQGRSMCQPHPGSWPMARVP